MISALPKNLWRFMVIASVSVLIACGTPPDGGADAPVHDAPEPEGSAGDGDPLDTLTGADLEATFEREGDWLVSPPMGAPEGARRVAVHLELLPDHSSAAVELEARGLQADGTWGPWAPVEIGFSEEVFRSGAATFAFEASAVALRVLARDAASIQTLQWTAAQPEPAAAEEDIGVTSQALSSDLAKIGVVSRSSWGARYNLGCSANTSKYRMAVHHTVTAASTSAAAIRSIEHFHVKGRGWCDIGYHFLITQDGRIWEGRRIDRLGGHVRNNNSGNIGISLVGCFQPGGCGGIPSPSAPPAAMQNAASKLIRHLAARYKIPIDRSRIRGHREHGGQTTSCPGDSVLVRLNGILNAAKTGSSPGVTPPPPPPVGCNAVARLAGADRFGTAAALSRELFPSGAPAVVIAGGEDGSPDALAAGPLARSVGGPLLLTAAGRLPYETAKELGRLKPQKAFIIGGLPAVSNEVEVEIRKRVGTVVRLYGSDRYETAARVAEVVGAPNGLAFIASGEGALVDALAAGSPAGALRAPLLLVRGSQVPAATAQALVDLKVTRTVVVGGASAVSDAVLAQLPKPSRIGGADRFATAAAVANFARDKGVTASHVFITRGDKLADALPVAASGRLLLLTKSSTFSQPTAAFVAANSARATLLGGSGALSDAVENAVCKAVEASPKLGLPVASCASVNRVAGANRFETAVALSQRFFPAGAQTVVIASGADGSPDAIGGAPLARAVMGPLLLTEANALPGTVSAELTRLGATKAIILGSEAVVSQTVASSLAARGIMVERLAGQSRFDTNAKVAMRTGTTAGWVFIASGDSAHLSDGLAAAGAAAAMGAPLLFTRVNALPPETLAALSALGATKAIVVGGPSVVGAPVIDSLRSRGLTVTQLAGRNRYASAATVADWAVRHGVASSEVFVSRGDGFADASAAAASGRLVLLSPTEALAGPTATFLAFHGQQVTLLGGPQAQSAQVEAGVCRAMTW